MSFTTRCPACGTVFRVVADQLKISDGWVRCGHCSDVFDATIHLEAWAPAPGAAAGPASAPPPVSPDPSPSPSSPIVAEASAEPEAEPERPSAAPATPPSSPAEPATMPDDDLRAWFGEGPLEPAAAAQGAPQDSPVVVEPVAEHLSSAALPAPTVDGEAPHEDGVDVVQSADPPDSIQPPDALAVPSVLQTLAVESRDEPESDFHAELERFAHSTRAPLAPEPAEARRADATPSMPPQAVPEDVVRQDEEANDAEPGFVRQARRRAYWSSPGMRVVLSLVAVLLVALLAGQWAIQQRHRLVAAQPSLKPWIEQACVHLGCDLAPVRRIDAVVIDSAELVRRLGNFHSFDIVLHNQSPLEVALPALELTLTDPNGLVIARRVFLPEDWPVDTRALAPNARTPVSFRLSISLGEGVPTAGYRALVFYP